MNTELGIDLTALNSVDVNDIDSDSLVDIRETKINTSLPVGERIADFIRQIKNPYCYKCGKTVVKIQFSNSGESMESCMEGYFRSL